MLLRLAGGSSTGITLGELVMFLELHRQALKISAIARQLGTRQSADIPNWGSFRGPLAPADRRSRSAHSGNWPLSTARSGRDHAGS